MNNFERTRNLVNAYVKEHGRNKEMTRTEFINWVHETYENISVEKNNLYPTDISFNLYNNGLANFPGPNLCLVYIPERNTFRLVGSDYKYTGEVIQYNRGRSQHWTVGYWKDGVFTRIKDGVSEKPIAESIRCRRDDLIDGLKQKLKEMPVFVSAESNKAVIKLQETQICGVSVEDETYRLFNASADWADKTSYLCEEADDGTLFYYLETIDECIGECYRLVMFEARKGSSKLKQEQTSELSYI